MIRCDDADAVKMTIFAMQRAVGVSDTADCGHPGCPCLPGLGS